MRILGDMNEANKKTILIVDDSPVIRKMIKDFLKDKFNIIEAGEPKECLKILAATQPTVDLGLIDVEMPYMNGFQLVKMIKKHPVYAKVPFIMVTSLTGKENVKKAVLAGACGYIGKPFDKEMLLQKINKYINVTVKEEESSAQNETKPDEGKAEPIKDTAGADKNGDDIADQLEFTEE